MFIVFQGVLRIPALTYIQNQPWYSSYALQHSALTAIFIAVSAGLFETVARYVGLKFLLKNKLNRINGVAYGIGHGGIEAILIVGLSYAANIVYSILINTGQVSSAILPQLISTSPALFLTAGIERVFAMMFHIAAALLVAYGILYHKKIYIFASFLFHSILDCGAVLLQENLVEIWIIELWVALIGLISLIFIIKSKSIFKNDVIPRE